MARLRSSDTYETASTIEVAGIRLGIGNAEAVAGMPLSLKLNTARANRMMRPTGNPNTSPIAGRNTAMARIRMKGDRKND